MEFVGVKSFSELVTASLEGEQVLKREALIFDRIGINDINLLEKNDGMDFSLNDNRRDLKWLLEEGVVFDPKKLLKNKSLIITKDIDLYHAAYHEHDIILRKMERISRRTDKVKTKFLTHAARTFRIESVLTALHLRHSLGLDAYPVFYQSSALPELNIPTQNAVQVALNALPIPDEATAWEQIIDFRSDPDSRSKFLDLRNWMNDITRNELAPIEIEQKLEHLIDQYQRHLNLHKMKTNAGLIETVVISSAELAEELIKFKWGKVAKSLFSFRKRKVAVLESELTSPGSEVAYIIKARKIFGR
jgi:hypothetical protein